MEFEMDTTNMRVRINALKDRMNIELADVGSNTQLSVDFWPSQDREFVTIAKICATRTNNYEEPIATAVSEEVALQTLLSFGYGMEASKAPYSPRFHRDRIALHGDLHLYASPYVGENRREFVLLWKDFYEDDCCVMMTYTGTHLDANMPSPMKFVMKNGE